MLCLFGGSTTGSAGRSSGIAILYIYQVRAVISYAAFSTGSPASIQPYLKDSFDYSNRILATLTASDALDRVEGRYAGPNTKLGISVVAVWHITDHYGQLVEYLRLNGIVPPFTQKYGLKVR